MILQVLGSAKKIKKSYIVINMPKIQEVAT